MGTVQILSSVAKQLLKNEKALWHGTGVSPQQLMEGASSTTPKFSSKFFMSGTGGMVQGPGLYATEIVPVGKNYGNLSRDFTTLYKGEKLEDFTANLSPLERQIVGYLGRMTHDGPGAKGYFNEGKASYLEELQQRFDEYSKLPSEFGPELDKTIGNPAENISNTKVKPSEERIADIFEKAGFAGTKYRGDRQKGSYYNYVLQRPERARILDAFKFGAAGVAASPFLAQPKKQTGR